ncbi:MAG: hypothetical protein Q9160_004187, partial [Pyrenula sp. 1 TL-2023]
MLTKASPKKWMLVPFFFHDRGSSLLQKTIEGLLMEILFCLLRVGDELLRIVAWLRMNRLPAYSISSDAEIQENNNLENQRTQQKYLRKIINDQSFSRQWTLEELDEAILALIGQCNVPLNVFFLIDALDEHYGNHRALVEILRRFIPQRTPTKINVKLCLASRPEPLFRLAFNKYPGVKIHEHTASGLNQAGQAGGGTSPGLPA